jgi:hypothetical protein
MEWGTETQTATISAPPPRGPYGTEFPPIGQRPYVFRRYKQ